MISRWIPAFALIALVGASGCTIRTGEAADAHHHNHKSPPPPPPKKRAEPKRTEPAPAPEPARGGGIVVGTPSRDLPVPSPADRPADRPADDKVVKTKDGWEKLGEATANGKNDHDSVPVGRSEGTFKSIKLRVKNSNVKMSDVVIYFTDGTKYSPSTRVEFKEGEWSKPIDLPGSRRTIKSVNFKYSDGAGSGSGIVEVWGL